MHVGTPLKELIMKNVIRTCDDYKVLKIRVIEGSINLTKVERIRKSNWHIFDFMSTITIFSDSRINGVKR